MEIKPGTIFIIALLATWLLGLVATQAWVVYGNFTRRHGPVVPRWKRWDYFGLLPLFAFFSWVPKSHYQLLYRDKAFYGELTSWNEVPLPERRILRFIWNPGRRKRFALEDLCRSLLSHIGSEALNSETLFPYCFAYLGLAYYVSQTPACPLSQSRQFMIAQCFPRQTKPPEILFVSPFFRLSKKIEAIYV